MQFSRHLMFAVVILIVAKNAQAHDLPGANHVHAATGKGMHNKVKIVERDNYRYFITNGIPDHQPGNFPRKGNPNRISEQKYQFRMPLKPKASRQITPIRMNAFGVAINGVPLDPSAAEWWQRNRRSGWQYEAMSGKIDLGLDEHHAHVQPNGAYHYHGIPTGLIKNAEKNKMQLLGYAADGFPIYSAWGHSDPLNSSTDLVQLKSSYRVKKGKRAGGPDGKYDGTFVEDYEYVAEAGDLDECNARLGVTPEYPEGIYHYFLTEDFPFIPRFHRGTADESFAKGPPGRNQHRRPGQPRRGRPPFPPPKRGF